MQVAQGPLALLLQDVLDAQTTQADELTLIQEILDSTSWDAEEDQSSIVDLLARLDEIAPVHRRDDIDLELVLQSTIDELGQIGGAFVDRAAHLLPDEDPPEPEDENIRPTGRQRREREPYTVTISARKSDWYEVSMNFNDRDFRTVFRVSQRTFWLTVTLIAADEVFISRGRRKQRPVYQQLGVFLIRYGRMGTHINFTALLTSFGEGTVTLYCRRVVRALRRFGLKCVGWPNEARKAEIKAGFKELCGLDGIVGALDGTLIDIAKRPPGSDAAFFSRKGTIATNVQAIVDHEGRFISFETGYPGSKNDTHVWKHSYIWRHRDTHFGEGEFVLADGGYPLSPYVLTPFARNERLEDGERKREFGAKISGARVGVERTFGRLKARFPSLVMMGEVESLDDLYQAIEAMMVVHNICFDLHDTVSGLADDFTQLNLVRDDGNLYDAVEQEPAGTDWGEGANINEAMLEAGRVWRQRCMDLICPE